jgi:hypothetical protein
LVVKDPGDAGLAQLFQVYSELTKRSGPVAIFQNLYAALAWIEDVRSGQAAGSAS